MLSTGCRLTDITVNLPLHIPGQYSSLEKMFMFELLNLQVLLTNLCQDSSLDIVLRLQLLEVIFSYNFPLSALSVVAGD